MSELPSQNNQSSNSKKQIVREKSRLARAKTGGVTGEKAERLAELFRRFDANGDGTISKTELITILNGNELSWYWSDDQISAVMAAVDVNHDGKLQYEEFVNWVYGIGLDGTGIEM
eukprot:gnl/TRDRNA2_/TRDRNA2_89557_c0_seq1.p2 gnl/TRDRNA2_/TRDRNA2_89557_c0~~gnl/TRDRNA2_/TRDRNA2_89557_c0_seq1.p2  ORF type:complete len:116 (-),score=13.08 gnl/TRDRNA2_/TRDRNA2_89557_c0_seq1:436-783(-)